MSGRSVFWHRIYKGITSPWSIGFSCFGIAYGVYHYIDMGQSGMKYELKRDLSDKTYIVTGATSGIGKEVTEELARHNARVVMACRDREKCIHVRRDIVLRTRNKKIYCRQCDLSDFESVRNFVTKISHGKFQLDRIDGILHNAATMEPSRKVNNLGIETSLATNHLGSFLLTGLILDQLLAQPHPVRIVFLNSTVIDRNCAINFDDFNFDTRKWSGYDAYKETKLIQAAFAKELSERVNGTNVTVTVADPGRTKTNLTARTDGQVFFLSRWLLNGVSFFMGERRVGKAIRPVIYAIADEAMETANGIFIDRERNEHPWCDTVMDKGIRERVWLTSVLWSRLGDHMALMQKELLHSAKGAAVSDPSLDVEHKPGRSWTRLWLW